MSIRSASFWTILVLVLLLGLFGIGSIPVPADPAGFVTHQIKNAENSEDERHTIPKGTFPRPFDRLADRLIRGVERISDFVEANHEVIETLSTVFVALFTFTLWRSTKDLWNAGERQIDVIEGGRIAQAAETAAAIAQATRSAIAMEGVAAGIEQTVQLNTATITAQKDFWQRQMRAYLSVDHGDNIRQNRRLRFEFQPNIINSGMTPAYKVKVFSTITLVESSDQELCLNFSSSERTGGGISEASLFPRQSKYHSAIFHRRATIQELRLILTAAKTFHVWGTVIYFDAFGEERFTNFSFILIHPRNKRGSVVWRITGQHNNAT